jgi:hypothetical protein
VTNSDTKVIPFLSPEKEEEQTKEQVLQKFRDSIQRDAIRRARWPQALRLAMTELAKLFPTMIGVPGTDPWNVEQLIGWLNSGAPTSGSRCAAMFLLGVWNPTTDWSKEGVKVRRRKGSGPPSAGRFDLFRAMSCWDEEHIAAFTEWLENPFWP